MLSTNKGLGANSTNVVFGNEHPTLEGMVKSRPATKFRR